MELTFRKKSKNIGKQSVPWSKNQNHRLWNKQGYQPTSFNEGSMSNKLLSARVYDNQTSWQMVEEFCWLYLGKPETCWLDGKGRYTGKGVSLASFSGIGMSTTDALTDEDEYVLEFGTREEKKELIKSIRLTSSYRMSENGDVEKLEKGKWEYICDGEEDVDIEEV